jgi:hypothetical protein
MTFDSTTPYDPPFQGPFVGISAPNYPSIVDPDSPGRNFEYTNGQFYMYYSTNWQHLVDDAGNKHRNLNRVSITVAAN